MQFRKVLGVYDAVQRGSRTLLCRKVLGVYDAVQRGSRTSLCRKVLGVCCAERF
jgi:hypothetical protein